MEIDALIENFALAKQALKTAKEMVLGTQTDLYLAMGKQDTIGFKEVGQVTKVYDDEIILDKPSKGTLEALASIDLEISTHEAGLLKAKKHREEIMENCVNIQEAKIVRNFSYLKYTKPKTKK
jgi:hypothetical protein